MVGVMYHKGEGVPSSPRRAFMWFSIAARKGDISAKASVQEMSKDMQHVEIMDAELKSVVCEASIYRDCDY
jgi:localization factor PodJL